MTKKINGGTIGLDDRKMRYDRAKDILGGKTTSAPVKPQITDAVTQKNPTPAAGAARTLKRGMEGEDVKKMQKALGIEADGVFGPGTTTAVKKWQRENGLEADGIVGPKTQARMFG
jgi:peptidoglycan hydrolase-like protein with peptidoglycan-binding domain